MAVHVGRAELSLDAEHPRINLIIAARLLASQTPGATAVENVDLKDLVSFARSLNLQSSRALGQAAAFASDVLVKSRRARLPKAGRNCESR